MISYSIVDVEHDFAQKKAVLDAMLTKARQEKRHCSYGVLKEYDKYSKSLTHEHIYTFQESAK
jgi:hypothetical protein